MKNSCRPGRLGGARRGPWRDVTNPAAGSQTIAGAGPAVDADHVSMDFGDAVHVPARAPALIAPDRVWTYGEVDRTTAAVARRLRACGVEPGEAVAVLARRDASGISGVLASTRAGAAFLALDPDLPACRDVSELFPARIRFTTYSFEPGFDLELSQGKARLTPA